MTILRFDAIILGGGFAGMAMAVALAGLHARAPLRVAIVDSRPRESGANLDGRAFAVTSTSRRMLETMGIWPHIAGKAEPVTRIEVSDGKLDNPPSRILLRFGEEKQDAFASVIESRFLYQAFEAAVDAAPQIHVLCGLEVRDVDGSGPLANVLLEDGRQLAAPLVIAADGRDSPTRNQAGIKVLSWPYRQYGMVATVAHEKPHNGVAVEYFLPAGPFAILPLPKGEAGDNQSSLVWTETEAEAQQLLTIDEASFAEELRRRIGDRLGDVRLAGPRRGYPLSLQLALQYTSDRLALIGDAAHVLHPIAGLGFNLGLRDIAALSDCILDAARLGLDIGSPTTLDRYQRWRRYDATKVALMTDGLNRLFSNGNPILRGLRGFGLATVDRARPLKRFFMQQAAGIEDDLPRLMAGEPL